MNLKEILDIINNEQPKKLELDSSEILLLKNQFKIELLEENKEEIKKLEEGEVGKIKNTIIIQKV